MEDNGGLGCMLVNESEAGKTAGCHPSKLADQNLRAFSTKLSPEDAALGRRIFDEVMPPIASKETLHEYVLDHWSPIASICAINSGIETDTELVGRVETVCCMEAPGCPELRELYRRAKATQIQLANEINLARPDSDGIEGDVMESMGNTIVQLRVPVQPTADGKPREITWTHSLYEASKRVKMPGVGRWFSTPGRLPIGS